MYVPVVHFAGSLPDGKIRKRQAAGQPTEAFGEGEGIIDYDRIIPRVQFQMHGVFPL